MKKIFLLIICFLFFAGKTIAQNNIQTSVVEWGFRCPFDYLCQVAKQNGVSALELVEPEKWERAKQNGMQVLVATGADLGIERGFCNPDFHNRLQERYLQFIPKAAENGVKMLICYAGIRPDMSPEQAMENCVAGLKPVIQCAEKYNMLVVMELMSSKRSKALWWQFTFPDYACDNAAWGAALADKLQSPNFKLLYDVWQMNDMGANILDDIQRYNKYIALYHISGKNRKAIADDDPMNYSEILKTIRSTGYNGCIGLEFLIEKDIPASIKNAVSLINNAI